MLVGPPLHGSALFVSLSNGRKEREKRRNTIEEAWHSIWYASAAVTVRSLPSAWVNWSVGRGEARAVVEEEGGGRVIQKLTQRCSRSVSEECQGYCSPGLSQPSATELVTRVQRT